MFLKIHRIGEPKGNFEIVRVSPSELNILKMIKPEGSYGYDIHRNSKGDISLSSVYGLMNRLRRKGLIISKKEEISKVTTIPKVFCLTTFDSFEIYTGPVKTVYIASN